MQRGIELHKRLKDAEAKLDSANRQIQRMKMEEGVGENNGEMDRWMNVLPSCLAFFGFGYSCIRAGSACADKW